MLPIYTVDEDEANDRFFCAACKTEFEHAVDCENHIMEVHVIENGVCKKDNGNSDLAQIETTHKATRSSKVDENVERLNTVENMIENVMRKNAVPSLIVYPCSKCDSVFNSERALNGHKQMHSKKHKGPYLCKYCHKVFSIFWRFEAHVNEHKSVEFCCSPCGKKFSSQSCLDKHVKSKHVKVKLKFKKARDSEKSKNE